MLDRLCCARMLPVTLLGDLILMCLLPCCLVLLACVFLTVIDLANGFFGFRASMTLYRTVVWQ